jgi:hypothetical protein
MKLWLYDTNDSMNDQPVMALLLVMRCAAMLKMATEDMKSTRL